MAAQGLLPVWEGLVAPGYAPAHLVGGVTYTVRSPQARFARAQQPIDRNASVARHLFGEYEQQQLHACQGHNLPQQVTPNDQQHLHMSQGPALLQQVTTQDLNHTAPACIGQDYESQQHLASLHVHPAHAYYMYMHANPHIAQPAFTCIFACTASFPWL